MIRTLCWSKGAKLHMKVSTGDLAEYLPDPGNFLWIDIYEEPNAVSEKLLREVFKFHPLSISDALEETHIPKVDQWDQYISLVLRMINPEQDLNAGITTEELDVFIGSNYIVTYHLEASHAIERTWEKLQKDDRFAGEKPAALLYRLLDEIADDFIATADKIDLILNGMEDQLFDDPDSSLLEEIFTFKRGLLHLRQVIAPQREVLNKLARGDFELLGEEAKIYFRDIYDHFLRLYEIIENLRDLTNSTLEIYLSVVNNRMNSVMKTLTIITTLFMPISFLAGFFGMNFFKPGAGMESWTSGPVFTVAILTMGLFPIGMLIFILRKGWLK